jgi:hypothetical protein
MTHCPFLDLVYKTYQPPKIIFHEDGNSNVCRNTDKATFYTAYCRSNILSSGRGNQKINVIAGNVSAGPVSMEINVWSYNNNPSKLGAYCMHHQL